MGVALGVCQTRVGYFSTLMFSSWHFLCESCCFILIRWISLIMLISFEKTEIRHKGIRLFLFRKLIKNSSSLCRTHAALDGGIFRNVPVCSHEIQRERERGECWYLHSSHEQKSYFMLEGSTFHVPSTSSAAVKTNIMAAVWDLFAINTILCSPLCLQDNMCLW